MPTQQKIERVSALAEKLERSTIAVTADYTGISVNEMNDLRRQMRASGVEFTIIKNTLMDLAADAANRPLVKDIVVGPTAIAFGYEDPLDVAKAITDFVRNTRSALAVRGAVMGDGQIMTAAEVTRLASLPPRAQLIANLLGQLQAPMQRLLGVLNGPLQGLGGLLQARINQLELAEPTGSAEAVATVDSAAPEEAGEPEETGTAEESGESEETNDSEEPAEPEESGEAGESTEPEDSVDSNEAGDSSEPEEADETEGPGESEEAIDSDDAGESVETEVSEE